MLMYPVLQNRTTWGNDWFILIFILCSRHDLSRFKKKKKWRRTLVRDGSNRENSKTERDIPFVFVVCVTRKEEDVIVATKRFNLDLNYA